MTRFPIAALVVLAMSGQAGAQLALPGSAPARPAKPAAAAPASPALHQRSERFASLLGKPLLLEGGGGRLAFSSHDGALRIDALSLPGTVISDPARKCLIDIVGDAPIEMKKLGRTDGLARYEAAIPACPIVFDLLDGAALVAHRDSPCVFAAADCQADPAGLWGPDGDTLESASKIIERKRTRAEAAATKSLHALESELKGRLEADDLAQAESDFATRRDAVCHDYRKEEAHGFCASRMAQARAALLKAKLAALKRRSASSD